MSEPFGVSLEAVKFFAVLDITVNRDIFQSALVLKFAELKFLKVADLLRFNH
jgi:hypothetical protein